MLNERELATVLAALRYYQNDLRDDGAAFAHGDIATDGGTLQPLSADEIDALCERLNVRPAPAKLSACCGAEIGYDAWVDSNGDVNGGPFDNSICLECCGENPDEADESVLADASAAVKP